MVLGGGASITETKQRPHNTGSELPCARMPPKQRHERQTISIEESIYTPGSQARAVCVLCGQEG